METIFNFSRHLWVSASPTRLEGMETQVKREGGVTGDSLRPALRGWKPTIRLLFASGTLVSDPP